MNRDIELSIYKENAGLKAQLEQYRLLIAHLLKEGALAQEQISIIERYQRKIDNLKPKI